MANPKLNIPPGTRLSVSLSAVTIHFDTEQQAYDFMAFVVWLDKQPTGTPLEISRPDSVVQ